MFSFNASLSDVAPLFLMSSSVVFDRKRKKGWIVDGCYLCVVSFLFTTQIDLNECCVFFQWITQ